MRVEIGGDPSRPRAGLRVLDLLTVVSGPLCTQVPPDRYGPELYSILEQELRKCTTADLLERARRFGVPLAPVHAVDAFLHDPQVHSNQTAFEVEDSEAGIASLRAERITA